MRRTFALAACVFTVAAATLGTAQTGDALSPVERGRALLLRAEREIGSGRPSDGLATLAEAEALFRQAGDLVGQARVEYGRANVERGRGNLDAAEARARRARDLARRGESADVEARALELRATLANDRGDLAGAAAILEEALPIAERSGDYTRALLLETLGRNARARGRADEALALLARAIEAAGQAEVAGEAGAADVQIRALGARSTTLLGLGRFDEALADADRAYARSHDVTNISMQAAAVFGLAQVHANIGSLERAEALWGETVDLYARVNLQIGVALATKQRMETRTALGDFGGAAEDGHAALALYERTGSAGTTTEVLARLALVEANRGHTEAATDLAARADALVARAPRARRAFTENDLALVALAAGDLDLAAERFARVLALAREGGNPEYEWRAHSGLGRVALAAGRPAEAQAELEIATRLVERLRRTLPHAAQRAAFMRQRLEPAEGLVRALMAQSEAPGDRFARQALETADAARGRALADLLTESRARLTDPRIEAVRAEETKAADRLSAIQKRLLTAGDAATRAAALDELADAERQFDALVVRMHRENPAYAALAYPQRRSAEDMRALLADDEAIVEYSIGEREGYGWVVRRNDVTAFQTPGRTALDGRVRLLQSLLAGDDENGLTSVARELYDAVVAPAATALEGARRIVLVPDGPLLRLPFAALRAPDDVWLVERFVLATAPSITVLAELRDHRPAPSPDALLVAAAPGGGPALGAVAGLYEAGVLPDGGLAHAADEARDVARALWWTPGAATVETDATEGFVKAADLGRYRIVHFAAHALVDDVVPRRSAVVLGPDDGDDGLLQVNEIANLSLNADLVVLATCRSHVGRLLRGEGFLSLSRTFMYAGARAVVATLWSVDDADTRELMRRFYQGLADSLGPDEALRAAQLDAMRAGGTFSRPGSWAAFVVSGDAGRPATASAKPRQLAAWAALAIVAAAVALAFRRRRAVGA